MSIICGCLKWLIDHQAKETKRCEAVLSGDVSVLPPVDENEKKSKLVISTILLIDLCVHVSIVICMSSTQMKWIDWLFLYIVH